MSIQLLYGVTASEKDIANATDNAKIFIADISYMNEERSVYIPFRYIEIKNGKNKGLYDLFVSKKMKKSLAIIKDVESLKIINNCKDKVDEITLLFGINIKGNEIYLSSAEEYHGDVLFEMSIIVNNIDIEIVTLPVAERRGIVVPQGIGSAEVSGTEFA
jgi:hypothetical protein